MIGGLIPLLVSDFKWLESGLERRRPHRNRTILWIIDSLKRVNVLPNVWMGVPGVVGTDEAGDSSNGAVNGKLSKIRKKDAILVTKNAFE